VTLPGWLDEVAAAQPYPLAFATVSGAHLYGFPSPDSDYDLRGAHILPLVVCTTPEQAELVALVPQLVTRHHSHHYLGFAAAQWACSRRSSRGASNRCSTSTMCCL
jgi:uncharacterized protein